MTNNRETYDTFQEGFKYSLKFAADIFKDAHVDDQYRKQLGKTIKALAKHGPEIVAHLKSLHYLMRERANDDGAIGLNEITYSPLPSAETSAEADEMVEELGNIIEALRFLDFEEAAGMGEGKKPACERLKELKTAY